MNSRDVDAGSDGKATLSHGKSDDSRGRPIFSSRQAKLPVMGILCSDLQRIPIPSSERETETPKQKPMNSYLVIWPTYWKDVQDLHKKRAETLRFALLNENENRVWERLQKDSNQKWERQFIFGKSIFDFFCKKLGVAVEVDGNTHSEEWDWSKDKVHHERYGISTLRVRNHSKEDLDALMQSIKLAGTWGKRRKSLGIALDAKIEGFMKDFNKHSKRHNILNGRKKSMVKKFTKRYNREPSKTELDECMKLGIKKAMKHIAPDWKAIKYPVLKQLLEKYRKMDREGKFIKLKSVQYNGKPLHYVA